MITKINANGGLEIYAENDLEAFALKIWNDGFINDKGKYTLLVDCVSYGRTNYDPQNN